MGLAFGGHGVFWDLLLRVVCARLAYAAGPLMPQPARIPRKVPGKSRVKAEAKKAYRAQEHVDMIKATGVCLVTGPMFEGSIWPLDPHHRKRVDGLQSGMGRTMPGRYVIPLRRDIHTEIEASPNPEQVLMTKYCVDARAATDAFWRARGDQDAITRIAMRFYLDAARKRGDL